MKILHVEDEYIIALGFKSQLRQIGNFSITHAADALDALKFFSESVFDLIILDVNLNSKIDGITVAHEIRKTSNVPIIFMSGYSDDSIEENINIISNSFFVKKPCETRVLKKHLDMIYENI